MHPFDQTFSPVITEYGGEVGGDGPGASEGSPTRNSYQVRTGFTIGSFRLLDGYPARNSHQVGTPLLLVV